MPRDLLPRTAAGPSMTFHRVGARRADPACHTVLHLTASPGVPVGATVLSAGRSRGGGMSFSSGPDAGAGAGSADPRDLPGGLLASAADRDATQAILEAAFAEQRLTQEEFEARIGRAMTARTEAELAQLVRDLPRSAVSRPGGGRRPARRGWLIAGAAAVVLAGAAVGISQLAGSGHGGPGS